MTFARIHTHRLACQPNNLPCAPSILKHRVSLGHKWISRGFTLTRYLGKGFSTINRSRKIHWTLITQEMREDLQIDFFPRNVLWMFLWDPAVKHQYPKSPPPPQKKKNRFLFGLGRPIRNMLSIFQDDRSNRMGLF